MPMRIDPNKLLAGLGDRKQRMRHAAETLGMAAAAKLEQTAKQSAPWTDRTGMARQTLQGSSGWVGDKMRVAVAGNMEYSPYLELTHEKQNAVLEPTVQKLTPEILENMRKIVQ